VPYGRVGDEGFIIVEDVLSQNSSVSELLHNIFVSNSSVSELLIKDGEDRTWFRTVRSTTSPFTSACCSRPSNNTVVKHKYRNDPSKEVWELYQLKKSMG
jgi:hypothetical protein